MRLSAGLSLLLFFVLTSPFVDAQVDSGERNKDAYVRAVTRGAGWMPWQAQGISEADRTFRAEIEARKDAYLRRSAGVGHPVIYSRDDIARAKKNAETSEWAQSWVENQKGLADYVLAQPDGWIESMLPEDAPAHGYGFTCPACVGEKSQEAVGSSLARWSYKNPDVLQCRACGQTYPDPAYPETAELVLPRTGYKITYYLNEAEQAAPDDRSGDHAWHWVGRPVHVSFSGLIRENKIGFMNTVARSLAFSYAFTDDVRYAEAARDVLVRYARCYRNWPYRDYWDTYADCDPMYAAWHDKSLPIEWKRHLSEAAYRKDSLDKAAMLQSYWGAGRVHPSTDSISGVSNLALAYDLTCTAKRADGKAVWSAEDRAVVERDLLLEAIMGAEPYIGGPGNADSHNNKAPRIYTAMAFIAQCLGIPEMADTALRGYEAVRDESFNSDGFCTESPSYNNMYLAQLLFVPETLHGFRWPENFEGRSGVVDYYSSDEKLRRMYRAVLWTLQGNGDYLPLSDTHVGSGPSTHIAQKGLRRYPEFFAGAMPRMSADTLDEYALFNLPEEALKADAGLDLPETYFPDWQTAILRHGSAPESATLTLAINPWGGHRHYDNLAMFYTDGGDTMVGDLGYVGDMPVNDWIKSTHSHNLVVVDGENQLTGGRKPEFQMMATSPLASVVEASSQAYDQCSEYRRRVVLIKAPDGRTFAVDLFRVAGGNRHAYRVYSEIAASDSANGRIEFDGVSMPAEPPLPQVGSSLDRADIYGLRDVRTASSDGDAWRATWIDDARAYRLHMLSPVDQVEASNGPGQRNLQEAGRRVRYVDAVRTGSGIASTFVAIHEPSTGEKEWAVTSAERLDASNGGAEAVVLRIDTIWGTYYLFNDCASEVAVDGIAFQGKFAAFIVEGDSVAAYLTVGAKRLEAGDQRFESATPTVAGAVSQSDATTLTLSEPLGAPVSGADTTAYMRVKTNAGWKGYPVAEAAGRTIRVMDYPLPAVTAFELPEVRYNRFAD